MNIQKTTNDNKTVFKLTGRLDTTTSPELQNVLIPEFELVSKVELDFSELVYISSAGLRVLLMGQKAAKAKGGEFSIHNVSDEIKEVFEMTGFMTILTIL